MYIAQVLNEHMDQLERRNLTHGVEAVKDYLDAAKGDVWPEYWSFLKRHGYTRNIIPFYRRFAALENQSLHTLDRAAFNAAVDMAVVHKAKAKFPNGSMLNSDYRSHIYDEYRRIAGPLFSARTREEFRVELSLLCLQAEDGRRW